MHDAWYFSIANLPRSAKEAIDLHFSNTPCEPEFVEEFLKIVDFMYRGVDSDGNMMRMKIRDLDRKRNQNLADVAPEFAKIIGYDYNDPDPNAPQT